jgi:hypothetical protein
MRTAGARERGQEMTRLYAVMACLVLVVASQLVLLLVAALSFARGETGVLWATVVGSAVCFAAAARLVSYILPGRPGMAGVK